MKITTTLTPANTALTISDSVLSIVTILSQPGPPGTSDITADQQAALDAASSPSAGNAIVTITDLADFGGGDMLTSVYDPTGVMDDAFDMDNMVEGADTKILTAAERQAIATNSAKVSYPGDQDLSGKQDTLALTTVGTSGAASLEGSTLNIPQYFGGAGGAVDSVNGQTGAVTLDTSDIAPTADRNYATDVEITAIAANAAKVGITTQQANDIETNNAKVGITTQQSDAIAANTAKVGITAQQASDITANNAKVSYPGDQSTANIIQAILASYPRNVWMVYGDSSDGGTTPDSTTQASIDALIADGVPAANIRWLYEIANAFEFLMAKSTQVAGTSGGVVMVRTGGVFNMADSLQDVGTSGSFSFTEESAANTFNMANSLQSAGTSDSILLVRTGGIFVMADSLQAAGTSGGIAMTQQGGATLVWSTTFPEVTTPPNTGLNSYATIQSVERYSAPYALKLEAADYYGHAGRFSWITSGAIHGAGTLKFFAKVLGDAQNAQIRIYDGFGTSYTGILTGGWVQYEIPCTSGFKKNTSYIEAVDDEAGYGGFIYVDNIEYYEN